MPRSEERGGFTITAATAGMAIFSRIALHPSLREEDPSVTELVRYIHLNPLRAGLVESLAHLDRYRWCGHSVVVGRRKNTWQHRDYVLTWFGVKDGEAKTAYRDSVKRAIDQGRRSDLVDGGLIRRSEPT